MSKQDKKSHQTAQGLFKRKPVSANDSLLANVINGMLRRCFYRNSFTSSEILHRSEKEF